MPSLEQELRSFVTDNFPFGEVDGLSNDDSLTDRGIIDSTGVLELVAFHLGVHLLLPGADGVRVAEILIQSFVAVPSFLR